jgi:RNA 3'-terminal phosphate cyclase (ATP)
MLTLDGSRGGGQQVRTALSLSAVTGRPFRMEHVRANRPNPGLQAQHLAAVEAVAAVTDATVTGAERHSETLTFTPESPRGGDVAVDVTTAGSVTLVCDAVLPLATVLDEELSLTVTGGTDVKWSPPLEYLRRVKLPLLERAGLAAAVQVDRRGFYPVGGGAVTLDVGPSRLDPIRLTTREELERVRIDAVVSESLSEAAVAERLVETAAERVRGLDGVDAEAVTIDATVTYVSTASPGAVLTVVADAGRSRVGFDCVGERGKRAEDVATEAVSSFSEWFSTGAPVDKHMADQLAPWVALAGGTVRVPEVSAHLRTNVDVIRAFDYEVTLDRTDEGPFLRAPEP